MVCRYRLKPNGSVRIWPTLTKQYSVRYTHYLQWTRTSLDWKIVAYSPNLMPVVFGRFLWMPNENCSQPLSHHLDVFVSTDSRLVSAPPQRSSKAPCPRYLRASKGPSVRWMSSFTGWTSQNMMDACELFFTSYKKLVWPFTTNVNFCDLQTDSPLTSLIAQDSMQTHRRPLLPLDVSGIQWFMGMLNHLRNFIPNLADLSDPLCKLLRKGSVWIWAESQ